MGADRARRRRRSRLLLATLGAGLLVLLIGVGERRTGLAGVSGDSASRTLDVGVESCNADPRVRVDESAAGVRLTAFVDRPGILESHDDCLDVAVVTLRAPLGSRTVADGSSGEVLAVSAPD